jgi:hypothetical protein
MPTMLANRCLIASLRGGCQREITSMQAFDLLFECRWISAVVDEVVGTGATLFAARLSGEDGVDAFRVQTVARSGSGALQFNRHIDHEHPVDPFLPARLEQQWDHQQDITINPATKSSVFHPLSLRERVRVRG